MWAELSREVLLLVSTHPCAGEQLGVDGLSERVVQGLGPFLSSRSGMAWLVHWQVTDYRVPESSGRGREPYARGFLTCLAVTHLFRGHRPDQITWPIPGSRGGETDCTSRWEGRSGCFLQFIQNTKSRGLALGGKTYHSDKSGHRKFSFLKSNIHHLPKHGNGRPVRLRRRVTSPVCRNGGAPMVGTMRAKCGTKPGEDHVELVGRMARIPDARRADSFLLKGGCFLFFFSLFPSASVLEARVT